MKTSISSLTAIALLAISPTVTTNATTQVYDLNAEWSDQQNPNGPWSYRQGDSLLTSDPFPWVGVGYQACVGGGCVWLPAQPVLERIAGTVHVDFIYISEGILQDGDVLFLPGVGGNVLWTAPVSGTIDISGAAWPLEGECYGEGESFSESFSATSWALTHNAIVLSSGDLLYPFCGSNPRSSPYDYSLGSGGTAVCRTSRHLLATRLSWHLAPGGRLALISQSHSPPTC
jgi:hypothetical protein